MIQPIVVDVELIVIDFVSFESKDSDHFWARKVFSNIVFPINEFDR